MSIKNKEYLELLKHAFDGKKFIDFIVDLLNLDSNDLNKNALKIIFINLNITCTYSKYYVQL